MSDAKPRNGAPLGRPTRRLFVAMLGAAAAAVVLRDRAPVIVRDPDSGRAIWVGH